MHEDTTLTQPGAQPLSPSPKPPALLTKEEIAKELQCSPRHIERLQRAKKIPVIRLSAKCVRYRRDGVLAALARLETAAVFA